MRSADIFETLHQWARRCMRTVTSGASNLGAQMGNAFFNFAKAWVSSLRASLKVNAPRISRRAARGRATGNALDPEAVALRSCMWAAKLVSSIHTGKICRLHA